MISFIVIGRNIEYTIDKCIKSILVFIEKNSIVKYEIIYVDSDSSDKTIQIAKKYPIKIILLKGKVNAAIGRNQGAKFACGNILYFLDGDMEVNPCFFEAAFHDESRLKYPFCSGDLYNKYYDMNNNYLNETNYRFGEKLNKNMYQHAAGGFFVIEKKYWLLLNGMDEKLDRNQDVDFSLRMSKINLPILIYNELFAIHHTVQYFDKDRIKIFITSNHLMYYGVLIRKHLFYRHFFYMLLRGKYSFFIMLFSVFYNKLFFLYLIIQLSRSLKNYKRDKKFLLPLVLYIFSDIYCFLGFLFYYPYPRRYNVIVYQS